MSTKPKPEPRADHTAAEARELWIDGQDDEGTGIIPCKLILRHDSDNRFRWYEDSGADTEVSGKTIEEAIAAAYTSWGSPYWNLREEK
jgi:hypothetical protein